MTDNILLRPMFVDRAGRLVYIAIPLKEVRDEETQQVSWNEGPPIAQVRMKPGQDTDEIEWIRLAEQGVEGDGTG